MALSELAGQLPELQLAKEFSVHENDTFAPYFKLYGFASSITLADSYHFGYLSVPCGKLACHAWRLTVSKGCVLVVHGLFDHVGLYLKLVDYLLRHGYSVVAVDLPGHGLSSGEVATIETFADYADALEQVFVQLQPHIDGPWFAVGQSTGGAALMRYAFQYPRSTLVKMALLAPLVRAKRWWFVGLAYWIASGPLGGLFQWDKVKRRFSMNSHDGDFSRFVRFYDPLQPPFISVRWVGAMCDWVNEFDLFAQSEIPVLVLQGTADNTVDARYNMAHIQRRFRYCEIRYVEGAMHQLVNEADYWRQPAFERIVRVFDGAHTSLRYGLSDTGTTKVKPCSSFNAG